MSLEDIKIPSNPSLRQMQAMRFEITKRMNVFLEMVAVESSQEAPARFEFAGINAKLQMPTLDNIIRQIKEERAKLNVT